MMDYKTQVEEIKTRFAATAPEEVKQAYQQATTELKAKHLEEQALKAGDKIPMFRLKNVYGNFVNIVDILKEGPVILNFFRGAWCPYCNLELRLYQKLLPQIKELGANLIAISPDLEQYSFTLKEKYQFEFEVVSDTNLTVSRQFGLVFQLDSKLIPIYEKRGFDLAKYHGNSNFELPFPATYVVNQEGIITLAFVDADYQNRLEPTEALEAIKKIKNT